MMNTAAARFSVNIAPAPAGTADAARTAIEALGATYERGFGNVHRAQVIANAPSVDLKAIRAAVEAIAPEGAVVKVAKLR